MTVTANPTATGQTGPAADRVSLRVDAAAWAQRLHTAAFAGLATALVWAPWPLGSNRPWALALLAALVWGSLVLSTLGTALQAQDSQHLSRWRWLPLAALLGFAGLVLCQLLNPGQGAQVPTTVDVFHTRRYLFTTLLYLGAWLLVQQLLRNRERAGRFLAVLLAAGLLQAIGAVLLWSAGGHYELWFTSFDQGGRATGTFPSPDNLAGYLELSLSAGLGWLLAQLGGSAADEGTHWRTRVVSALGFMMSRKMLLRLLLVVLVIALVMTHSRMGNGAFFVAMAVTGGLVAWRSQNLRRPALWLVASMVLVDLVVIGQWVGLDRVVERMKDTAAASSTTINSFGLGVAPPPREESLAQRLEIPRLSLQLVAQRPWFGHGGGTYISVFPPLKRAGSPWQWTHAHNDYVQVACDTGLLGLALWLTVGVATAFRAARLLHDAETRVNRGLGVAAVMALSCYGLHGMVDFNLHIPSNALTFTVLLAAVWAVPTTVKRRRRASRPAAPDLQ